MSATVTQVSNYIASMRVATVTLVSKACLKERLGHTDTFCYRQKVILATAYLKCLVDYFNPYLIAGVDDYSYDDYNFFTIDEIKDIIRHLNNICDTFYTIEL